MQYTYLIGWSKLNKYYYGVRYAKNCHPSDLWTKYFTSSKYVKQFREENGEPDIIQIRRTFNSKEKAINWENRVLKHLKVINNDKWLNQTDNYAIADGSNRIYGPAWNKGMKGFKRSKKSIEKQKNTITGKKRGPYLNYNHNVSSKKVLFRGKIYSSISGARRDTGAAFYTIKKHSQILKPNQEL